MPPGGQIGPITPEQRKVLIAGSAVFGHYEKSIDRESAYEVLTGRAVESGEPAAPPPDLAAKQESVRGRLGQKPDKGAAKPGFFEKIFSAFATSAARSVANSLGRQISRGILGGIFGGARRR